MINILVVDGSKTYNNTLCTFLKNPQYKITQAFTLEQANESLNNILNIHYIILNISLPDGEADEFIDNITNNDLNESKIIILSDIKDIQKRNYLFEQGVIDYFSKDIPFPILIQDINFIIYAMRNNKEKNILVIDDSAFVRKSIANILKMKNYNIIKNFIFTKIQLVQDEKSILEFSDIDFEITNAKTLLGIPAACKAVFGDILLDLSNDDFIRMKKELETHFDVKMEEGILIQGEEQQNRDTTWWTGVSKQECNTYYWDRYKKYLKKSLPDEVIKVIDIDTDIVMDNTENPDVEIFSRYGMVVGHVQSGKTANYSALICKAADAGYKFIVVIAGGINIPLIPGIMPTTNFKGVQSMAEKCGTSIPEWLSAQYTGLENDFERRQAISIKVAVDQCRQLISEGFDRLHFYTLNQHKVISEVCNILGLGAGSELGKNLTGPNNREIS